MIGVTDHWTRSSRSMQNGDCVEARRHQWTSSSRSQGHGNCLEWRKSSWSDANGGNCVEWRKLELIGVRDSKNPDGPVLQFSTQAWTDFITGVRNGEFDI